MSLSVDRILEWRPHPKQEEFLRIPSTIFEVNYGGAAGGGKSECLLWFPIAKGYYKNSRFKAIIFRREFVRLEPTLIARSLEVYPLFGAKYNQQTKTWTFPSGATVRFGHLETEKDVYKYDSAEFHLVMFDELTEFTEFQYRYLLHRIRTTDRTLPPIVRASSTPGNIGHSWVRLRFVEPQRTGRVIIEETQANGSITKRMFLPAKVTDNPTLMLEDPTYINRLMLLPEAERRAKLDGDWWVFSGQVFTEFRLHHYEGEPENALHVIDPFEVPEWWPKVLSIDWGYDAMTHALWTAVSPDARVFAYREYVTRKMTVEEWGSDVARIGQFDGKICAVVIDPSAKIQRGDPKSIKEQFMDASGYRNVIDADNDRISGKQVIHEYLRFKQKPASYVPKEGYNEGTYLRILRSWGEDSAREYLKSFQPQEPETNLPKLQIFKHLAEMIKAIPLCIYSEKRKEDIQEFDGDDPIDNLRYNLKQVRRFIKESAKQFKRVTELDAILHRLHDTGDQTTFHRQMERHEAKGKSPISVKRAGRMPGVRFGWSGRTRASR